MLLRDRPFDKAKLKQFCLRFTVPSMYRDLLWKILLGVIPVYEESHDFVMAQRKSEFYDLRKALRDAKITDDTTKPHQMFLMVWLLRTRRAKIDISSQLETPLLRYDFSMFCPIQALNLLFQKCSRRAMSRMAESLWNINDVNHTQSSIGQEQDKLVDVYWILGGFLDQVQKFSGDIGRLQECTFSMLEREDKELYNHLINIESLQSLPFESWFHSCFADTICDSSITKYVQVHNLHQPF